MYAFKEFGLWVATGKECSRTYSSWLRYEIVGTDVSVKDCVVAVEEAQFGVESTLSLAVRQKILARDLDA